MIRMPVASNVLTNGMDTVQLSEVNASPNGALAVLFDQYPESFAVAHAL
jgi:hypothetical protein